MHMRKKIYDDDGIEIFKEANRFFIRYDAGAHAIVIRLDEISQEDAVLAMQGPGGATQVLFSLQQRLLAEGVDPYKTNL
jgi:hypothetical protein